ncbi:hypothetical protein D3C71_1237370 [compost metagenome]
MGLLTHPNIEGDGQDLSPEPVLMPGDREPGVDAGKQGADWERGVCVLALGLDLDGVTGNERFQDFLDGCGKDLWRLRHDVGALAHQWGHGEGSVQLLQTQRHIAGVKGAQDVEERGFAIAARPNQEEGLLKADRHQRAGHRLLKECTHLQVGLKEI